MAIDQRVIKAALDSFESDDFLQAKELVQGQVRQAKNDFLKSRLELKGDIEKQFTELTPNSDMYKVDNDNDLDGNNDLENEYDLEPEQELEPKKTKKRPFVRKKIK